MWKWLFRYANVMLDTEEYLVHAAVRMLATSKLPYKWLFAVTLTDCVGLLSLLFEGSGDLMNQPWNILNIRPLR
jgi:hypothetical protein